MTDPVNSGAQNTEAAATTTETTNEGAAPDKAAQATLLFGDNSEQGSDGDKAKGDEGKEAGAPADEDPSKQNENPDDKDAKSEDGKKDEKSEGAPEEYADFTMPEGVELNAELTGELKTLAKELNLSQKDAQRLADLGAKQAAKLAEQPATILAEARKEWETQARNDKEFGGKNIDQNLAVAKKAIDAYGTPELKRLLNESALGNHPDVIRFMYRVGKSMSEDSVVRGQGGAQAKPKSAAETLYGDNN